MNKKTAHAPIKKKTYQIGDVLPDGWIVGPVSPTTHKVIAIESPKTAPQEYRRWHAGESHAEKLRTQGHTNARQPNSNELTALYNEIVKADRNQAAQLNTEPYIGKYWASDSPQSAGRQPNIAYIQRLDSGVRAEEFKDDVIARVRCIRDEPELQLI